MKYTESQTDFSGGMVDLVPPDRIPQNAYAFGENIEHRDVLRVRRGDLTVFDPAETELEGCTLVAAGRFVTGSGEERHMIAATDAEGAFVTGWWEPSTGAFTVLDAPTGVEPGTVSTARFVQYYGRVFILFGWGDTDNNVWEWDGASAAWAVTAGFTVKCGYAIAAYGRVWAVMESADGFKDEVYASDIVFDAPLTFPESAVYSFRVGAQTKDSIVAMVELGGGRIVVVKEKSVHVIHNCMVSPETIGYEIETVDARNGGVGRDAAIRVGADVWYLSKDGIRSVALTSENNVRAVDVPVSRPVQKFFNEHVVWTGALLAGAAMAVYDNYVLTGVPYGGDLGGGINAVVVWDLLTASFAGVWTDIPSVAMLNSDAYTSPRVVCWRADCSALAVAASGDAHWRPAVLKTRGYSLGDVAQRKRFLSGLAEVAASSAVFSLDVCGVDTTDAEACLSDEAVESPGWSVIIPPEGLYVPDEGLTFASEEIVGKLFFMGAVARAATLTFTVNGPMSIRSVSVSASRGKKLLEV